MTRLYLQDTRPLRIAVAGCGTVGGAFLDLLTRHADVVRQRVGRDVEVSSVLVRDAGRPRSERLAGLPLTDDLGAFLHASADVVVEAIGGTAVAGRIARATLTRGRKLITANKALLRAEGPALAQLAETHEATGAALEFEAAVGGAVPVVRAIREGLAGHGITAIRGVLNGTTNYILSRVERGESYDEALRSAQEAGFAEADPARDLLGIDSAEKIAVLAWIAFGIDPTRHHVRIEGLDAEVIERVRRERLDGRVVRLVAQAVCGVGSVPSLSVAPIALDPTHPLARARDEENVVVVESESAGAITLHGKGAGGHATASAVLADLLHTCRPRPLAPRLRASA